MPDRKSKTHNQKSAATDWSGVAEWYDQLVGEEGSEFHREVIFPGTLRLLALQPGEAVLDVACGQGAFCRVLHQRGVKPTGVDASTSLIKLARERSDNSIKYFVGDAKRLEFLPAAQRTSPRLGRSSRAWRGAWRRTAGSCA
jgi:ubiquinone/menaquinone biosynthesis C-methylase UbiE